MSALDADQQQEDVRVAARVPVQTRRAPEAEPAARPGRLQVERVAAVEPKAEAAAPFAATAAGVEAQIGVQVEGGEAVGVTGRELAEGALGDALLDGGAAERGVAEALVEDAGADREEALAPGLRLDELSRPRAHRRWARSLRGRSGTRR